MTWFKIESISVKEKEKGDIVKKTITLKAKGVSDDFMTVTMKFDNEDVLRATLQRYGIRPEVGERFSIDINANKQA